MGCHCRKTDRSDEQIVVTSKDKVVVQMIVYSKKTRLKFLTNFARSLDAGGIDRIQAGRIVQPELMNEDPVRSIRTPPDQKATPTLNNSFPLVSDPNVPESCVRDLTALPRRSTKYNAKVSPLQYVC